VRAAFTSGVSGGHNRSALITLSSCWVIVSSLPLERKTSKQQTAHQKATSLTHCTARTADIIHQRDWSEDSA